MEDEVGGRAANQQLTDAIESRYKRLVQLVDDAKRMFGRDAQAEPARYRPTAEELVNECKKAAAVLEDVPESHPLVQKLKLVFYDAQDMISYLQWRARNWDRFVRKREEAKIELDKLRKSLDELLAKPRRSAVSVKKDFDAISEKRKKTSTLNNKVRELQMLSKKFDPLESAYADVRFFEGEAEQMEKQYDELLNEMSAEIKDEHLLCDAVNNFNTEMNAICDMLSRETTRENIENVEQLQLPALRAQLAMLKEKYREANRVRKHVDPDSSRFAALEDRMKSLDSMLGDAKTADEKNEQKRIIAMITARLAT